MSRRETPLQTWTRAVLDPLLDARSQLDDDPYRALLETVRVWLFKELERLTLGEALRALDEDKP